MGLGIFLVWPVFSTEVSASAVFLCLLGGAFYIVGIIFFILGEYKPIYHTIWHLFVVAAAAIHWFAIYFFIVQTSLENTAKTAVTDLVDSMQITAQIVSAAAMNYTSGGI